MADAPDARGRVLRGRIFAAVRAVVTLAIIAGLLLKLSPGDIARAIGDADPSLLVAAAALMLVVQALVVTKWIVLLRVRAIRLALLPVARAYCVSNLLTTVLPTAVGGDVYRVYRVQREAGARAADVTMSVLYERATGYAAMTCLGALGAAFHFGNAGIGLLALLCGVLAAVGLAVVLPHMPVPAVRDNHFLRNFLAHRREMVVVYQMAVFSLLIQALYVSTIALAGRALGVHVSWGYWAFVTWVVALATLLPLTLGGLGVRESSYSALLVRGGAAAAQGASTGFALGILLIAANTLGLLVVELAERLGYGNRLTPPVTQRPLRSAERG